MIIQGHHPSHGMNQSCISNVVRLADAKAFLSLSASHNNVFILMPLTGQSWILLVGESSMLLLRDSGSFYIVVLPFSKS